MAAAGVRYKKFLRLCEQWPLDKSKSGRDLGEHIREQVAKTFNRGEATIVNPEKCDRIYASLEKINSNYYQNTYSRVKDNNCSGLTLEQCTIIISNDTRDYLQSENASWLRRVRTSLSIMAKRMAGSK